MTQANVINSEPTVNNDPECPDCKGLGYIEGFSDEWSWSAGHYTKDCSSECETCESTGEAVDE